MIRIAVVSMALGLCIMIISLATGNGLKHEIREKVIGFTGHVRISAFDGNQSMESSPVPDSGEYLLAPAFQEVEHKQRYAQKAGIIKTEETLEGAALKGVGPEYRWDFLEQYLLEGKVLNLNTVEPNDSVWISATLARQLEFSLGDRFTMYFIRPGASLPQRRYFTIAGIFKTGLEEFDRSLVVADIRQTVAVAGWDSAQIGGWELFLSNPEHMTPLAHQLDLELPYDLKAESASELNPQIFQWLDLFDFNIVLITGILLVVALINLSTALLIIILDRTRMVGLLKALGASGGQIRMVFVWIAFSLVGRGLLWGTALGTGLALVQKYTGWVKLDPENYYVDTVPIALEVADLLLLNATIAVVSLLALWIPAALATRIRPILALRFE